MELVRGGRVEVPVEELEEEAIGGSGSRSALGALRLTPEALPLPSSGALSADDAMPCAVRHSAGGSSLSRGSRQAKQAATGQAGAPPKARVLRVDGPPSSPTKPRAAERQRSAGSSRKQAIVGPEPDVLANDGQFVTASKLKQQLEKLEEEEFVPPALPALSMERHSKMRC